MHDEQPIIVGISVPEEDIGREGNKKLKSIDQGGTIFGNLSRYDIGEMCPFRVS